MLIFLITLVIIVNLVHRADFFSVAGMTYISFMSFTQLNKDGSMYIIYLRITLYMIAYDVFWIFFNFKESYSGSEFDGGVQNSLKFISLFLCFFEIASKLCLLILFYLQKLNLSRSCESSNLDI